MNLNSPPDEYSRAGVNLTASQLLDEHHDMVPEAFGDGIACTVCGFAGADAGGHATATSSVAVQDWIGMTRPDTNCRHCHRPIVEVNGAWVDPEATGDDVIWRETCDAHDTFVAEHEPEEES